MNAQNARLLAVSASRRTAINTRNQIFYSAISPVRCGLRALYASCLLVALMGCASQAPLRPPSLKLPSPVTGLAAERIGDAVELRWTTPSKATDGVGLTGRHGAGGLVAEICRSEAPAPDACAPAGRVPVTAGAAAVFHDGLPLPLLSGNLRPLHYGVRVVNAWGRGAKYATTDTLAGAAPPAVTGLVANRVTEGVALRWQPDPSAAGTRLLLHVDRLTDAAASKPAGAHAPHEDLLAVEAGPSDPGGAVDAGAKAGVEQRYAVYRVQTVQAGTKGLTARGQAVTVTVSASAKAPPPPAPTGLEALVNTLAAPEIDLVWQPVEGAAGYLVFRGQGDEAPRALTPQPIAGLSYADPAIRAGVRYRYSLVSVDADGAGGPRSPEVAEMLPQP